MLEYIIVLRFDPVFHLLIHLCSSAVTTKGANRNGGLLTPFLWANHKEACCHDDILFGPIWHTICCFQIKVIFDKDKEDSCLIQPWFIPVSDWLY